MKHVKLTAEKRSLTGRKVKQLRKKSIIPATVYGRNIKSRSLSIQEKDFFEVYNKAGRTSVIHVAVGDNEVPVLIHHIQRHAVNESILHVEFFQVDLKQKVKTTIPIIIVGEAPASREKTGVVLQVLQELEIEALPNDIPDHIDADVSNLSAPGDEIPVSALHTPPSIMVLSDKTQTVVQVSAIVVEKEEPKPESAPVQESAESKESEAPKTEDEGAKEG